MSLYKISRYTYLNKIDNENYYLINSLNQELIFGDKNLKSIFNTFLHTAEKSEISRFVKGKKIQKWLFDNNFLVLSNSEVDLTEMKKESENKDGKLTLLRILLTDVCNFDCKYCKVEKNLKSISEKAIGNAMLEKTIKVYFSDQGKNEVKVVHITGGEPLIFWDKVKKIVSLISMYKNYAGKTMIVLGTNSYLLDNDKVEYIKNNEIKVIVSLDGEKVHNDKLRVLKNGDSTFNVVDKSIKLLRTSGVEVGISLVVGKHNIKSIEKIIRFFLKEYNPASLGVNFMKPPSKNDKNFPFMITPNEYVEGMYRVYKIFRDKGLFFELIHRRLHPFVYKKFRYHDCGAALGSTMNIDAKGRIGPCKSFLVMEKIFESDVDQSAVNKMSSVLRQRAPITNADCLRCEAIAICGGGCSYSAYLKDGNYLGVDDDACRYSKLFHHEIIKDIFELVNKKIKKNIFYIISDYDRKKLLGKIKENKMSLSSSIGHEN